jgi:hypothetical protein
MSKKTRRRLDAQLKAKVALAGDQKLPELAFAEQMIKPVAVS